MRAIGWLLAAGAIAAVGGALAADVPPDGVVVVGDAIPQPLTDEPADAARGKALLVLREAANCVLCHAVPAPEVRFHGDVGPTLAGAGKRFTAPQLRLRIVDMQRVNPATIMPSYYRTQGLDRVAAQYRGKPILGAREVEDLVAYIATLQ